MKAKPDSSDSLVFECDLEEPPEKVWRALTEPELLEAWLKKDESRRTDSPDCQIVSAEPYRLLRYRWRDRESGTGDTEPRQVSSVVTVELSLRHAGGTHLRLTHGDFRIVSGGLSLNAARVSPLTSARRRRVRAVSCGPLLPLRRAA